MNEQRVTDARLPEALALHPYTHLSSASPAGSGDLKGPGSQENRPHHFSVQKKKKLRMRIRAMIGIRLTIKTVPWKGGLSCFGGS